MNACAQNVHFEHTHTARTQQYTHFDALRPVPGSDGSLSACLSSPHAHNKTHTYTHFDDLRPVPGSDGSPAACLSSPDQPLVYSVLFAPPWAMSTSVQLIINKPSGGRWRFEMQLQVCR